MPGVIIGIVVLGVVAVVVVAENVVIRRRGYAIPGRTIVRCARGHLFRTTWIEGGSLTAVRLGPTTRYQHCPVGRHWAVVHPVRDEDLTDDDRRALGEVDDTGGAAAAGD